MEEYTYKLVVLTRSSVKLQLCMEAIHANQRSLLLAPNRIVVVADDFVRSSFRTNVIMGQQPFNYAANVNAGILACGDADVVLLSDDAYLGTRGGFDELAALSNTLDIVGPVFAGWDGGNPVQALGAYSNKIHNTATVPWLTFACAYLTRRALNTVGALDVALAGYGYEDKDFCRRAAA